MQHLLSLVARILYPFIHYYGVFFTAFSLHGGTSFSSVALYCTSHTPHFTNFLSSSFILLNKLNLVAEECVYIQGFSLPLVALNLRSLKGKCGLPVGPSCSQHLYNKQKQQGVSEKG